jgi:hypothetical protein
MLQQHCRGVGLSLAFALSLGLFLLPSPRPAAAQAQILQSFTLREIVPLLPSAGRDGA